METFNSDPKPGRLILPLVLIGMIATTYTFINRVAANNNLEIIEENVEEVENEATEDPPELRVNSFLMCESMIDSLRKPMNISDSFPISLKRVYCYSGIRNALSPREIMYEWYFQDQLIDIISIRIGRSVHWRSWTYKSISDSQIGEWYVILRDQITDIALDTTFFTITDE